MVEIFAQNHFTLSLEICASLQNTLNNSSNSNDGGGNNNDGCNSNDGGNNSDGCNSKSVCNNFCIVGREKDCCFVMTVCRKYFTILLILSSLCLQFKPIQDVSDSKRDIVLSCQDTRNQLSIYLDQLRIAFRVSKVFHSQG